MENSNGGVGNPQQHSAFGSFLKRRWHAWISLNVSWSSRWWFATVHTVTAVVGAGVLSLPDAMRFLGWELGTVTLLGFILYSLLCYWQIIQMRQPNNITTERTSPQLERFNSFDKYYKLGQHVLGEQLGFWLIIPLQMTVQVGVDTIYIIIGASSLKKVYELLCTNDCTDFRLYHWMLFFMLIEAFISYLPNIASITWLSIIAAFTAIGYSTIAWISVLTQDRDETPPGLPTVRPPVKPSHEYPHGSAAKLAFGVFSSLGKLAFSTAAGHNVALEIHSQIPDTPQKPSKVAMWNGVLVAYIVILFCYVPVALTGYGLYGNQKPDNCLKGNRLRDCHILLYLEKPKWMIVLANIMVCLHMLGSYQVFAMPLFNNLEMFVETKFQASKVLYTRLIPRLGYLVFTCVLAATLPFFSDLETLVGGLAIIPTTYLIPGILWQIVKKPRKFSLAWVGNMTCIVLGILLMFTLSISGVRNLVVNGKNYKFFYQ